MICCVNSCWPPGDGRATRRVAEHAARAIYCLDEGQSLTLCMSTELYHSSAERPSASHPNHFNLQHTILYTLHTRGFFSSDILDSVRYLKTPSAYGFLEF